jgi:hypothetical protein
MQLAGGVAEVSILEVYEHVSLDSFFLTFMQSVAILSSGLETSARN